MQGFIEFRRFFIEFPGFGDSGPFPLERGRKTMQNAAVDVSKAPIKTPFRFRDNGARRLMAIGHGQGHDHGHGEGHGHEPGVAGEGFFGNLGHFVINPQF